MPRIVPRATPLASTISSEQAQAQAAAAELLRRRMARIHTLDFTQYVKPNYAPGDPHRVIAAELDMVLRGENDRLIILAPPRHGKSELGTRNFPALYLGKNPGKEIMSASFDGSLADEFGRDVRSIVTSDRYRDLFPAIGLAEDSKAKGRWHTEQGGAFLAAGIGDQAGGGSGITGRGADLLSIDDPFKDRSSAESASRREHVWNWYKSTAYTRLSPTGAVILIQTRWHQDDLAGRLLQEMANGTGDNWRVVTLSAADPITNEPVAVWKEKFPVAALHRIMMAMGGCDARDWVSLYGQRPTAQKGVLFKIAMIQVIEAALAGGTRVRAWDLAATRETGTRDPSWTTGVRMNKTADNRFIVENVIRFRGGPDEVEAAIMNTAAQDGPQIKIGLPQDPGQAGKAQVLHLTKLLMGYSVESSPESGDKATRASPIIAQANVGNMGVVRGLWNNAYLDELGSFPNGMHNDQVDATSRASSMLMGKNGLAIWEKLGALP